MDGRPFCDSSVRTELSEFGTQPCNVLQVRQFTSEVAAAERKVIQIVDIVVLLIRVVLLCLVTIVSNAHAANSAIPKPPVEKIETWRDVSSAHRLRLAETVRQLLQDERFLTRNPEYRILAQDIMGAVRATVEHDAIKNNLPDNHPVVRTMSHHYGNDYRSMDPKDPARLNIQSQVNELNRRDDKHWDKTLKRYLKNPIARELLSDLVNIADFNDVAKTRRPEFGANQGGNIKRPFLGVSDWIDPKNGGVKFKPTQLKRMVPIAQFLESSFEYEPIAKKYSTAEVKRQGFNNVAREIVVQAQPTKSILATNSGKTGGAISEPAVTKNPPVAAPAPAPAPPPVVEPVVAKVPTPAPVPAPPPPISPAPPPAPAPPAAVATIEAVTPKTPAPPAPPPGKPAVTHSRPMSRAAAKALPFVGPALLAADYFINPEEFNAERVAVALTMTSESISDCQTVQCNKFRKLCADLNKGEAQCAKEEFYDKLSMNEQTDMRTDPDFDKIMQRYSPRVTDIRCEADGKVIQLETFAGKKQFVKQKIELDQKNKVEKISFRSVEQELKPPTIIQYNRGLPIVMQYMGKKEGDYSARSPQVYRTLPPVDWQNAKVYPHEYLFAPEKAEAIKNGRRAANLVTLNKNKLVQCCGDRKCADYFTSYQSRQRSPWGIKTAAGAAR